MVRSPPGARIWMTAGFLNSSALPGAAPRTHAALTRRKPGRMGTSEPAQHNRLRTRGRARRWSESLPYGEGAAPVELAAGSPSYPVARVELELVDDEEMRAQAHRVRHGQLLYAAGAIEPRIGDCVVEQTDFEDVSQEREAILDVQRHEPPGIFRAEGPAEEVAAADRFFLRKHDEPGARDPPRLERELVPSQVPQFLVARGKVERALVTRVRRAVEARAEGELVLVVPPDRLRIEGQRERRVRAGPGVREGVLRPGDEGHSCLRLRRVEQPALRADSQRRG